MYTYLLLSITTHKHADDRQTTQDYIIIFKLHSLTIIHNTNINKYLDNTNTIRMTSFSNVED